MEWFHRSAFPAILCLLAACGKHTFPDYEEGPAIEELSETDAVFEAPLEGLNGARVRGRTLFWIRGNQFYARIVVTRGPRNVIYHQHLHSGARCPTEANDRNGDGALDYREVLAATGEILIPLDNVVEHQEGGGGQFPESDGEGEYDYSRAAALRKLLDDLYEPDRFPEDGIAKLVPGARLALHRRTVVLYGARGGPLRPVACAVLRVRGAPIAGDG
jgi:hypothetical protein